jgi:ankyrin repeat protein
MFSAYYGCQDAIEILVASQAKVQIYDKKGRTCLHYAALNDSARQIETIFLIAKASPAELSAPTNFEKVDEDKEESKKN